MATPPKKRSNKVTINKLSNEELDTLASLVLKAQQNLVDYRKYLLELDNKREVPSPKFHYDWSDILLKGDKSFAIEGFRESGKDQLVMRSFPLYTLSFPNPNLSYIVLIMANATLVEKKMKEIQREFFSNDLLSSGVIEVIEQSASAFEVKLAAGSNKTVKVRIEGYGKGGSIRGLSWVNRRPDVVVMNDIQDIQDARSDATLDNDFDWFLDDVLFLGRDSRIFMIGNNLGEKCIIERIARTEGNYGFEFRRVPIADGTTEDSTPAWPEMFSMQYILDEREKYAKEGKLSIWTRNRMCECVADEDKCFRPEDFLYFDQSDLMRIAGTCNLYLRIDPSAGVREANDPSALIVLGINKDNNWFVFDIINKRMKQSEKIDAVFQLASKWPIKNVGVENSKEGIILMQDLRDQMPRRNIFFPLIEVKHGNTKKEARIEALEPRFKSRSVWFPQAAHWLPELEQQLTMFSRSGKMTLHDDIIDCLAYFTQVTQAPIDTIDNLNNNQSSRNLPRHSSIKLRMK